MAETSPAGEKTGERTLVEAIAEDLRNKRLLSEIRKEYVQQDFPRLVIEDAIEEARLTLDKGKKRYDIRDLEDKGEEGPKEKKKEEKSVNVFPLIAVIIIIWLGIMASFYLAAPFGHAVDKLASDDKNFLPFCKRELQAQGGFLPGEVEEYCGIARDAVNEGKTTDDALRAKCNRITYVKKEVDSCAATLKAIIDRYR